MTDNEQFRADIISRGSYLDITPEGSYQIEAITLRLNSVALNEWILSEKLAPYDDIYGTREDYQEQNQIYMEKRLLWEAKIKAALCIKAEKSVSITQAMSEVFTAVRIYKV